MKRGLLALLLIGITACSSSSPKALTAVDAWARFSGTNAAAYVTISNTTSEADALIGVSASADIAKSVRIHQTTTNDGDMLGMREQPTIDLPADFELKMSPGSYHIMLIDVQRKPAVGEKIPLTLQFRSHEPIVIDAEVRG